MLHRIAVGTLATIAFALAGCGSQALTLSQSPASAQVNARAYKGSWMLPEAKNEDLLYISRQVTSSGEVEVYSYKSRQQVGSLTGFSYPSGQCIDSAGNIWVTYNGGAVEYAHGGSSPINKIRLKDAGANGCSVALTGDLALSVDVIHGSNVEAVLEIFAASSGKMLRTFTNAKCYEMGRPGFDDKGNLFVECFYKFQTSSGSYKDVVLVGEVVAGGSKLVIVPFMKGHRRARLNGPGTAMWDGTHMTFSSYATKDTIHRAKQLSDGSLVQVGGTEIVDGNCKYGRDYVSSPYLVGEANGISHREATVLLGNNDYSCTDDFNAWKYPVGGTQEWSLHLGFLASGESVSLAAHP